ncbi:MAG: hypothetical protein ACE5WD_11225 [Candidatus Aminicenantia bacterium]
MKVDKDRIENYLQDIKSRASRNRTSYKHLFKGGYFITEMGN